MIDCKSTSIPHLFRVDYTCAVTFSAINITLAVTSWANDCKFFSAVALRAVYSSGPLARVVFYFTVSLTRGAFLLFVAITGRASLSNLAGCGTDGTTF